MNINNIKKRRLFKTFSYKELDKNFSSKTFYLIMTSKNVETSYIFFTFLKFL